MPPIRKHHHQQQVTFNNHRIFDPWNSSSTGHQRGETSTGTAWRRTREEKLAAQFSSSSSTSSSSAPSYAPSAGGETGGNGGEWVWMNDHPALGSGNGMDKESGQRDIRDMFSVGKGSSSRPLLNGDGKKESCLLPSNDTTTTTTTNSIKTQNQPQIHNTPQTQTHNTQPNESSEPSISRETEERKRGIFSNLTIHLNAPSSPLISDHALRHLLVAHGASLALSVSRRVTHIIVGRPNTSSSSPAGTGISGAGGGLSATKLQREIAKAGCRGFRVVGVEWVLESIKAGKRLSEARFAMNVAGRGQRSVLAFV
ncbi:hypothetical protein P168DRAFT_304323 [Aspergillus campestris IBT 28561]|uniref:BRCT domain-containing protein n=1 Tax=Aspergillus campestris (strain IBT 28561) TaxID=1392248 RepID=A0A2I1D5Z8_ASPC2|nr:uncharacterized protein P168DRAFT_304323 [Aspergillus campestris IBT 28561]PKY05301.1 hypothetical protein P168DRAFT_304323 [Aspergillus campestris IBT 28561]